MDYCQLLLLPFHTSLSRPSSYTRRYTSPGQRSAAVGNGHNMVDLRHAVVLRPSYNRPGILAHRGSM